MFTNTGGVSETKHNLKISRKLFQIRSFCIWIYSD